MTAGNSTPLSDGAAPVLLARDEWAAERGLPVLAHLTHAETAAIDYVHGDEGLLMAPVHAVPRLLERAGLTLQDFDLYEIHEAFAAQVLATLAAWEPDARHDRPRASSTSPAARSRPGIRSPPPARRILATAAKLLAERDRPGRALISICAAGGQGVAAIVERS